MTLYDKYYNDHATPDELQAVLGKHWAICRDSFENRCRHGLCVTHKQYKTAEQIALKRRQVAEPAKGKAG